MTLALGLATPSLRGHLQRDVPPSWVVRDASLDVDLVNRRAFRSNQRTVQARFDQASLSSLLTLTRASVGTHFQADGDLASMAADAFRFDHDPATLEPLGLLMEVSRTNSVTNNTMVGASAPATLPTGWSSGAANINIEVVATGVEKGVDYIDIRIHGTPTATSVQTLRTSSSETITAGTTWAVSGFFKLVAGTTANISTFTIRLGDEAVGTVFSMPASLTRVSNVRTAVGTQGRWTLRWNHNDTVTPVDITIRIGLPQRELGDTVTSPIKTTGTAATRAFDIATIASGAWLSQSEGTLVAEWEHVTTPPSGARVAVLDDGSNSNRHVVGARDGTNLKSAFATVSGSTGITIPLGAWSTGRFKTAYAFEANNCAASINGAAAVADTSGAIPSGLTTMRLGGNFSGGSLFGGYLRRVTFIPRRVTNAQLQALSA